VPVPPLSSVLSSLSDYSISAISGNVESVTLIALVTLTTLFLLVEANRTFDMLVLPSRNHHFNYDPYFIRRQFDYFVLNLQGAAPPDYVFDVPWIA